MTFAPLRGLRGVADRAADRLAERVQCEHAPPCGGCGLITRSLGEQHAHKLQTVRAALARFPSLADVVIDELVPAPLATGYRTRAKLAVDAGGPGRATASVRVGLYRPGTHEVVDIPRCRVLAPGLVAVADRVRAALGKAPGVAARVRHVDLRWSRAQGQAHVTLVVETAPDAKPGARPDAGADAGADIDGLARALHDGALVAGVAVRTMPGGKTPRALAGPSRAAAGEQTLVERFAGATFRLSPGTFFQADPAAAEALWPLLAAHLGAPRPGRHLWDLYAGAGALAIPLARAGVAERVTAIESVDQAVWDGEESAQASGAATVRFKRARVEDVVRDVARGERPDRLVLDPPRRGVPHGVLVATAERAPARAAYVSCEPLTLARDLDVLRLHGLRATRVVPLDLFALTEEVEAVALLEPAPPPPPEVLWRGEDVVAIFKPASLGTDSPPGRALVGRVRALPGCEGMDPVHRLDRGTSGIVLFARGDARRRLGAAFEARTVEKRYVALVRGITHEHGKIDRALRDRDDDRLREAVTRYERTSVVGGHALLAVRIETGRLHQIRRHLAGIGHPIVGDTRHGHPPTNRHFAESLLLSRPFLHAGTLAVPAEALRLPAGAPALRLECPLPPDLQLVLERLTSRGEGSRPARSR